MKSGYALKKVETVIYPAAKGSERERGGRRGRQKQNIIKLADLSGLESLNEKEVSVGQNVTSHSWQNVKQSKSDASVYDPGTHTFIVECAST